ncbi:hypothetical protein NGA_0461700 [Nannochloropsis gaditana CCMP526]|uniref:uncharacterized protein n=1 Tax=Nannochloropsis gaditana (strain CCMP526) TaxID=1093141 RepID=UPI00029F7ECD|nr:hypothetical protein NGA_0461700 [Nannochloropsis gaditana CCMP526]EKU22395.1 hypothetical protein NGA_0461700 [Nannochloropsis gaditana CCMP526]|eukprot:XP_005853961.1 hypothetical protein NGA_0461700 [Nannochloropsis gaditana CCMP526]
MARIMRSVATMAMLTFASLAVAESPMRRMQSLTGVLSGAAKDVMEDTLPAYKPDGELTMMQDTWKNGLDIMKLFETSFASPGMKAILDDVETQHKIMENLPLLAAFDGFKEITGRRLDDAGTTAGFTAGLNSILKTLPDMLKTMKDPSISTRALSELLAEDANNISEAFAAASAGDGGAMDTVNEALNKKLYPGVNTDVLKTVSASDPLSKVTGNNEIMRLINDDPIVTAALTERDPAKLDAFVKDYAASRRFRFSRCTWKKEGRKANIQV